MMDRNSITQIRKEMERCVGKRIQLKANKGRKKTIIREGIIENVYPSIFTVSFENEFSSPRMVSYSYTDILTHTVEIKLMPGNYNNVAL
ncbi:MAG TPA: Veg protein [Clostridiaceae bacterium]|nr:Veg protein [Clostridiaceae bacterium]